MSTCKCGQPAFNCHCTFAVQEPFTYEDEMKLRTRVTELEKLAYTPKGFLWSDCLGQAEARIAELEQKLAGKVEECDEQKELKQIAYEEVDFIKTAHDKALEELAKVKPVVEKYHELLYQVENVIPDESRHDTAKRIIHQHENRDSGAACQSIQKLEGEE